MKIKKLHTTPCFLSFRYEEEQGLETKAKKKKTPKATATSAALTSSTLIRTASAAGSVQPPAASHVATVVRPTGTAMIGTTAAAALNTVNRGAATHVQISYTGNGSYNQMSQQVLQGWTQIPHQHQVINQSPFKKADSKTRLYYLRRFLT